MHTLTLSDFRNSLAMWTGWISKLKNHPAANADVIQRAVAMWACHYCYDSGDWGLRHEHYIPLLSRAVPGSETYFVEYAERSDLSKWCASWCGLLIDHKLRHLFNISRLMDLIEKTRRAPATPRELLQAFNGAVRLWSVLQEGSYDTVESFAKVDDLSKDIMKQDNVTHPNADQGWV